MNKVTEILFPQERLDALKNREDVKILGRIIAVVKNRLSGDVLKVHGVNIVTNAGDLFYAQRAMGETPTVAFHSSGGLRLGTGVTAPVKTATDVTTFLTGSGHTIKSTYPKTNDGDTDNTGTGTDIATWTYEYLTTEGNGASIAEGAIVNDITTPTSALSHFLFAAPFTKTSSDTLKVIINHQFNGV